MLATMRTITWGEERLVALAAGDESAPLALCLHGFPDVPETYASLLPALAERGWHAVAPYLRGYAPSALEGSVDIDGMVADVLGWADHLSPDRPIALVGHDWGAAMSHFVLRRHPARVRAAVLMSVPQPFAMLRNASRAQLRKSWYMGFFQLGRLADAVVARDDFAFVERLYRDWSPGFEAPPAHLGAVKRSLAASMPRPLDYYREVARGGVRSKRWLDELADPAQRPAVPVLYMHGERDGCIGPEVARGQEALFAGPFEQVVIEGAGHFLQLEADEEVNARILGFLGDPAVTRPRAEAAGARGSRPRRARGSSR